MSGTVITTSIVVGGGIVGSAIARALAGTDSVGRRSSRRATTSATAPARPTPRCCTPGSTPRRARWSRGWWRAGYELLGDYAEQTGIPVERTGALLVAWTDEELDALPRPEGQGRTQRLPRVRDRRPPTRCTGGCPTSAPARWAG